MPDAIGIVEAWAGPRLSSDATLQSLAPGGVYSGQASEGAGWPYVVLGEWNARAVSNINGDLVISHVEFEVIAISKGDDSFIPVENILQRVYTLLHQQRGSGNGGEVYSCVQDSSDRDAYSTNDVIYRVQSDHYRAVVR